MLQPIKLPKAFVDKVQPLILIAKTLAEPPLHLIYLADYMQFS